ncbi:hypothetical protein ALC57_11863 [Trachymyrmex cornetzi]|uniref:Uncharacterized protein n=1 Tax=Trachymyrmex cornetzi TaxID=471704 RepID=A0A195DTP1_9HYME|nr:hypothetical protein ALC57_11863 [Trachymyrmex cornetzi]
MSQGYLVVIILPFKLLSNSPPVLYTLEYFLCRFQESFLHIVSPQLSFEKQPLLPSNCSESFLPSSVPYLQFYLLSCYFYNSSPKFDANGMWTICHD